MSGPKVDTGRLSEQKATGERENIDRLMDHMRDEAVAFVELHDNLCLFVCGQIVSRVLFIEHLYRQILDVTGYIMEFGVRYGANLSLYLSLRGMYEPYNLSRHVIGFDTFEGFSGVTAGDKEVAGKNWKEGDYSVPKGYAARLDQMLQLHESFSPISHVKRYDLRIGDVRETLPKFLTDRPETVVALAYFDMDIYAPTKEALRLIKPRLHKGSVLVFDELCCDAFPGETRAVLEELSLANLRLKRYAHQPYCSYAVIE
jgi:hypothetical protein